MTVLLAGSTRFTPTLENRMPFLSNTGTSGTLISSGLRQLTATQGFDGTNWK